jgi:hypothetical protein
MATNPKGKRVKAPFNVVKVIRTRHYQYYDVLTEKVNTGENNPAIVMRSAYTKDGDYIGNSKWVYKLVHVYGIRKFAKASPTHKLCSIGWSPEDNKWYGWSQRAVHGFGIGSSYKDKHARNTKEAKRFAASFANDVA